MWTIVSKFLDGSLEVIGRYNSKDEACRMAEIICNDKLARLKTPYENECTGIHRMMFDDSSFSIHLIGRDFDEELVKYSVARVRTLSDVIQ